MATYFHIIYKLNNNILTVDVITKSLLMIQIKNHSYDFVFIFLTLSLLKTGEQSEIDL